MERTPAPPRSGEAPRVLTLTEHFDDFWFRSRLEPRRFSGAVCAVVTSAASASFARDQLAEE